MPDVILVGGGHNSLVAAAYLAKAGIRPLVLERSERVGGCAVTGDIAPGFRAPLLAHAAALDPAIVRDLNLARHGLQVLRPEAAACAPTRDGRALVLWADAARAAQSIAAFSAKDAERYPQFVRSFAKISGVLRALMSSPPPSLDAPTGGDFLEILKTGRRFRALGRGDAYRLIRWLPMAVADLAGEWFESEPLKATVAAGGILGSFLGPWSAGSGALLMLLGATEAHPIASGWFARGGIGAIADSLAEAARSAGAELRTGAEVTQICVEDGRATGVLLASGERLTARIIVSGLDPKRTLLGLVDPGQLQPEIVQRVRNIRAHGTLAKINFAVSALPAFPGVNGTPVALSGRIRLARDIDGIERAFDAAKYGSFSDEPWIELTIPSLLDQSLAPSGQHVVSAYVQYAPYHLRGATWEGVRDAFADAATRTIAAYAPRFEQTVVARQVVTPVDLERQAGLTGGHIFHGELALDQFFVTRPLLGWARYRTPIDGLFLCGSGTHPGTGLNGRSGALAANEIVRELKR